MHTLVTCLILHMKLRVLHQIGVLFKVCTNYACGVKIGDNCVVVKTVLYTHMPRYVQILPLFSKEAPNQGSCVCRSPTFPQSGQELPCLP